MRKMRKKNENQSNFPKKLNLDDSVKNWNQNYLFFVYSAQDGFLMLPLKIFYDEYIDWPKLNQQKDHLKTQKPPLLRRVGTIKCFNLIGTRSHDSHCCLSLFSFPVFLIIWFILIGSQAFLNFMKYSVFCKFKPPEWKQFYRMLLRNFVDFF